MVNVGYWVEFWLEIAVDIIKFLAVDIWEAQ